MHQPLNESPQAERLSQPISIANVAGIQIRPAAFIVECAQKFQSKIKLNYQERMVDAKSLLALLALNIPQGATIRFQAIGPDADLALSALEQRIHQRWGNAFDSSTSKQALHEKDQADSPTPNTLQAIPAAPGIGFGTIYQWRQPELNLEQIEPNCDVEQEREQLRQAIANCQAVLQSLADECREEGNNQEAELLLAHQLILGDPALSLAFIPSIDQGKTAAQAWCSAIQQQVQILKSVEHPVIASQASDLLELSDLVLHQLLGTENPLENLPTACILVAERLTPSQTSHLNKQKVIGLIITQGGATSHAALLARAMNIPTLVGAPTRVLQIESGVPAIIDGYSGTLYLHPSSQEQEQLKKRLNQHTAQQRLALHDCQLSASTQDGYRIEVMANIANIQDAQHAQALGAEGVGLLRSEFLYLDQVTEPDEEQQTQVYIEIADSLGSKTPLVIRTLDAGGEKSLPYLPLTKEKNPALGERGLRLGLQHLAMLRHQVRAILRASRHADIKIMFPMVATLAEFRAAKQLVKEEAERVYAPTIEIGIMVEVPSAAIRANLFAAEVDFFSIGTNDLTQYTLAMDRSHPHLGHQVDALDPAVLQLIQMTTDAALKHGKWVGVCGGAASDVLAIPILLGLGVRQLSCSIPSIPQVKQLIRQLSMEQCQKLAQQALAQDSATAVRALLTEQPMAK